MATEEPTNERVVDIDELSSPAGDGAAGDAPGAPHATSEQDAAEFEVLDLPEQVAEGEAGAPQAAGKSSSGQQPEEISVSDQLAAMHDKYLRLMAEFDNYKRRTSRDYAGLVERANEALVIDLVEVREGFDRALKAGQANSSAAGFAEGMKLLYAKLDAVLQKYGLEAFGAQGDPFDPVLHDALMKTPHEQIDEDRIVQVFESGYKLKGRVIRHARVIVSGGRPGQSPADDRQPTDAEQAA